MRTCLAVLFLVAACKEKQAAKPPPPPPTTTAPAPAMKQDAAAMEAPKPADSTKAAIKPAGGLNTADEYEAKAFELTDKLSSVFAAGGTNCEKLANNLERFLDQ